MKYFLSSLSILLVYLLTWNRDLIAFFVKERQTQQIEDFFSDSLTIGRKGKNKIEISKIRNEDACEVILSFYSREGKNWLLKNRFQFAKDLITDIDPQISDFNNDGYNDITYVSNVAARGANEVRRLLIYDPAKDVLIPIQNSEEYPNMAYNKELNCIDAFLVHGGSSTVFLILEGNQLKEIASVHNDSHRTVYKTDKNGNSILISTDTLNPEDIYMRYKNFDPPEF
ncbi:hypothetical protein [Paenimyroides ceti]